MNERLTLEIDAQVQGLEKGLSRADRLLKQHERNHSRIQKVIGENSQKSLQLERSISQLNREFKRGAISEKQYTRETDRLGRELREVNNSTKVYQRELNRVEGEIKRVTTANTGMANSTQRATQTTGKFAKTTRTNAVPAMTSFSQVIQDSPYGIQGVANNIQQLTMQMGYLSNQAGGTKGAIKAMASSLIGPAGILLAVSVVTSLLVSYGDELMSIFKTTNKLADATKELVGSVKAEISVLNGLLTIARDENKSKEDRQRAIDKINDLYGDYLPNLTTESVRTEEVATAVDNLSKALIRQAKIRGVQDLISEKAAEIAKEEADAIKEATETMRKARGFSGGNDPRLQVDDLDEKVKEVRKNLEKPILQNAIAGAAEDSKKEMQGLVNYLQNLLNEDVEMKGIFTSTKGDAPDVDESVRVPIEPILGGEGFGSQLALQLQKDIQAQISELKTIQKVLPETSKEYAYLGEQIQFLEQRMGGFTSSLTESGLTASEELTRISEGLTEFTESNKEKLQELQFQASLLGGAFSSLATQMVDSMIEGELSVESFRKMFMKTMANIMIQMAQRAIMEKIMAKASLGAEQTKAGANAITIATNAAAAMGPAGAIALPGLIAAMQGMVQGAFGSLQAFATGGMVGGNSYTGDKVLARLNSGEGVLTAQGVKNAAMMMSAPSAPSAIDNQIEFTGEFLLEGENLRAAIDRNSRRRNRIG